MLQRLLRVSLIYWNLFSEILHNIQIINIGHLIWDPLLHGITPEAKRDYDKAVSKGNIQLAEQIRHRIGHEIISAFWAG